MKIIAIQNDPSAQAALLGALRIAGVDVGTCEPGVNRLPFADAYVLAGDVAASDLSPWLVQSLVRRVESGAGLLFTGGPQAFGRGGHATSELAHLLPVDCEPGDDRENVPSGLFLRRRLNHPIVDGLPWDQPPVVTGCHRVVAKPGARTLLEGQRILAIGTSTASFAAKTSPLLVIREVGAGRVAALATDLAGRWSAGLTSWGTPAIPLPTGEELGGASCRFLTRLTSFLAGSLAEQQLAPWTAAGIPRPVGPRTFVGRPASSLLVNAGG